MEEALWDLIDKTLEGEEHELARTLILVKIARALEAIERRIPWNEQNR